MNKKNVKKRIKTETTDETKANAEKKTSEKKEGKKFENDFKQSFPEEGYIYRLRDSGSTYGGMKDGNNLRFSITNMCDFLGFYKGHLCFFELKSTKLQSLPKANIKPHQLDEMLDADKKDGVYSYIVVNFREIHIKKGRKIIDSIAKTYLLPVTIVKSIFDTGVKSLSADWCQDNGIELKSEKKRTRYKYDIRSFLESIKEKN